MWFWWVMLFCNMLIPLIMVVVGFVMIKFPKKRINWFYGYRTSNAMKNQETWDFSQKYSGKMMLQFGLISLLPSIIFTLPTYGMTDDEISFVSIIIMCIQMVLLIIVVLLTEIALKKKFNFQKND